MLPLVLLSCGLKNLTVSRPLCCTPDHVLVWVVESRSTFRSRLPPTALRGPRTGPYKSRRGRIQGGTFGPPGSGDPFALVVDEDLVR